VLRLLERHPLPSLTRAVERALAHGALTRDAVAQFLYVRELPAHFDLSAHPHLQGVRVQAPDLSQYTQLIT
jgi:hypothetical protein